jgi:hypothetical protein
MAKLKIVVHDRVGFDAKMLEKHVTSTAMLEEAVNSKELYAKIMSFRFTNTLGLTNGQIYAKIISGAESLDLSVDYEADIWVQAYYQNNRVVGYTMPNIKETYLNTKFFGDYDYAEIADNMLHEWLHKIGFDHSSASDHASVPYAIGYMVEELVHLMMSGTKLTPMDPTSPEPKPDTQTTPQPQPEPKKTLVCYRSWRTLFRKRCYWE